MTIDAGGQSRIFDIDDASVEDENFDVALESMTLTGGKTTAPRARGGAIRSLTSGDLNLVRSTVTGNTTLGSYSYGGGIFAEHSVTLSYSSVSGNSTEGRKAHGGGIFTLNTTLLHSIVSGNRTEGRTAYGGGIRAKFATLEHSSISGNSTRGNLSVGGGIHVGSNHLGTFTMTHSSVIGNSTTGIFSDGGGIYAEHDVELTNSTVAGNSTSGDYSEGGGIYARQGGVMLTQSSVADNSTAGAFAGGGGILAAGVTMLQSIVSGNSTTGSDSRGGGIYARGIGVTLTQSLVSGNWTSGEEADGGGIAVLHTALVTQSTVTDNHATGSSAMGGGVVQRFADIGGVFLAGSIVSGNTAAAEAPDVGIQSDSLTVDFSLVGDTSGSPIDETTGTGNLLNVDPLLGPLADHGGPTMTHALLPGSPALDAGDPSIGFDPNEFDQRGDGFFRVVDGGGGLRIDIGAYESQGIPLAFPDGDYNHDGIADAADYTLWHDTLGGTVPVGTGADGVADGLIDQADYDFWRENFGNTTIPLGAASSGETAAAVVGVSGLVVAPANTQTEDPAPLASAEVATPANDKLLLLLTQDEREEPERDDGLADDNDRSEGEREAVFAEWGAAL